MLTLEEEETMIDTILGIGASFDWISPLASILGDVAHGPSHTFLIPYRASPLSGREVSRLLGKHGVRSWGYMVVTGTLMLKVRLSHARWAQHHLTRAGVPIENPLPAQLRARRGNKQARRSRDRPSVSPRRKAKEHTLADSISEVLNMRL